MRRRAHSTVARDLALGALLGAATAAVAETRGHTLRLALRTVRDAGDTPSLALGLVAALATTLLVLLAPRLRVRMSALLVLPSIVLASAILAGGREAAMVAARAMPSLTLAQRLDALSLAFVRAGGFFALGAIVSAALLAAAAIVIASRARPATKAPADPRRLAALAAGLLGLAIVAAVLWDHGRSVGWAGAAPCAVGVLAIFLASSTRAGPLDLPRRAAAEAVAGAAVLAVAAVACMAVARGLVAGVGLGDDGPSETDWNAVVALWRGRFRTESASTLAFVVPVLAASLVALPSRAGAAARSGAKGTALAASMTVALAMLATLALRGPAASLATFGPTGPPAGFAMPPMPLGGDCQAMVEDSVVYLGAGRVWRGRTDVGPAGLLDDPATAAVLAGAQFPATSDIWLSVDGAATFGRLGRLLDALAEARADAIPPRQTGRQTWRYPTMPASPCTVHWAGRAISGPGQACARLTLAHPYCYEYRPDPEEKVEPERIIEVSMTERDAFRVRLLQEAAVLDVFEVPRAPGGHGTYPELAAELAKLWKYYGQHINVADRKFDFALLRAAPDTPVTEVLAALESMRTTEREIAAGDRIERVPAFDVGVALPGPRRTRPPPLEELAPGVLAPDVVIEKFARGPGVPDDGVLASHLGSLRACAARAAHPVRGVRLQFSIDREGFPFSSYVDAVPLQPGEAVTPIDKALSACLVRALDAMPFEPPPRTTGYNLTLRFGP